MKLSELIADEINYSWLDHETLDTSTAIDAIIARLHECVKPLEWPVFTEGHTYQSAKPIVYGRPYNVRKYTKHGWAAYYDENKLGITHDTIEVAKAAAQAHYAALIIEGLDL